MAVTVDQATRIIRKYRPDDQSPAGVDTLQKVTNAGYRLANAICDLLIFV